MPLDNSWANQNNLDEFEKRTLKVIDNKMSSFAWDNEDSVIDSSPSSFYSRHGYMENSENLQKPLKMVQQASNAEIKDIDNTKNNKAITSATEPDHFSAKGSLKFSHTNVDLNFSDHKETSKYVEEIEDCKLSRDLKDIDTVLPHLHEDIKTTYVRQHDEENSKAANEVKSTGTCNLLRNSSDFTIQKNAGTPLDVNSADKIRKFDRLLEKKFGIGSTKKKPSDELVDIKNDKEVVTDETNESNHKDNSSFQKDDVYAFEDEDDTNEGAEFSYQSFDKNVLRKRKTNATFQRSKLFKCDPYSAEKLLDLENGFNLLHAEVDESKDKSESLQMHTSKLNMPFKSNSVSMNFIKSLEVEQNSLNPKHIDNKIPDKKNNGLKRDSMGKQNFQQHFQSNIGTELSQEMNKGFNEECDKIDSFSSLNSTGPLSRNKFDNIANNSANVSLVNNAVKTDATRNISNDIVNNDIYKIVNSIEKRKRLIDTIVERSSRNDTDYGCMPKTGKKMYKYGSETDLEQTSCKNELQELPQNVGGSLSGIRYDGSDRNYSSNGKFDHFVGKDKYSDDWSKTFGSGNRVVDKRLEAIRKVSLWIGDCIDSCNVGTELSEDLLPKNAVKKTGVQKNGICASLSESFNVSSVKTNCAVTNRVKCAMSKAMMKSNAKISDSLGKCANNTERRNCVETVNLSTDQKTGSSIDNNIMSEANEYTANGKTCVPYTLQKMSALDNKVVLDSRHSAGGLVLKSCDVSKEECSNNFDLALFMNKGKSGVKESEVLNVADKASLMDSCSSQMTGKAEKSLAVGKAVSQHRGRIVKKEEKIIGKDGTLKPNLSEKQHAICDEQILDLRNENMDLSVKNFDEQSFFNNRGSKNNVDRSDTKTCNGAEVLGHVNTNNVEKVSDESTTKINATVQNIEKGKLNLDKCNDANVDKSKCFTKRSVECLNKLDKCWKSASNNRNCVASATNCNNSDSFKHGVDTLQYNVKMDNLKRGDNMNNLKSNIKMDIDVGKKFPKTAKVWTKGDNSCFEKISEDLNHTYPGIIVNTKQESLNVPLDIKTDTVIFEKREHAKHVINELLPAGKKKYFKRDSSINKNIRRSLPDLGNVKSSIVVTNMNKIMPGSSESHVSHIDGHLCDNQSETGSPYDNQSEAGSESSPHMPAGQSILPCGFSSHDWTADDLSGIQLDIMEDHSLENINPLTIISCPVSVTDTFISMNKIAVSLDAKQASVNSVPVTSITDPFSVNHTSVSNSPGSINSSSISTPISSERNSQVSSNFYSDGNQLQSIFHNSEEELNIINQEGNQFSKLNDSEENQFSLEDELTTEKEDYQWNETLKSFIMQNLENEPKGLNWSKEPAADVELLLEQKLAEQYLNRNIESLKRKHSESL